MQRYVAEWIGTFCLVFAGCGAVVINDTIAATSATGVGPITHVGVALVFGLIVMAMIYSVGDVSGAHLNPAVTLGFWVSRRFPGKQVLPYIVVQSLGALAASGVLRWMFQDHPHLGATLPVGPVARTFVMELILTAMLMFVILCVSTGAKEKGLMAGIAVGGLIAVEAMFAGPITGASMNPARSLGPALVSGKLEHLWVYLLAPVLGALIAVPWCMLTRGEAGCCGGTCDSEEAETR